MIPPPSTSVLHTQQSNTPEIAEVQEDLSVYEPLAESDLEPLVNQVLQDYSCADLLYLLPGSIPIPSFSIEPAVPSTSWVDPVTRRFRPKVLETLAGYRGEAPFPALRPSVPFPSGKAKAFDRQVIPAPLIVRHQSADIYTLSGRARILDSIGIPRDSTKKILIVSFGGQKFKKPRSTSATPSTQASPEILPVSDSDTLHSIPNLRLAPVTPSPAPRHSSLNVGRSNGLNRSSYSLKFPSASHVAHLRRNFSDPPRIATPTHIYIPGAPGPISNPNSPDSSVRSPRYEKKSPIDSLEDATEPRLLPDGWIAVVCGAGADWGAEDLPEELYVAPRDIYMPDLLAVGDVLLGKLGYGTVAECVDSCTPFIYGEQEVLFVQIYVG